MIMSIPIQGIVATLPRVESETAIRGSSDKADFGTVLGKALNDAGATEKAADEAEKKFAAGDPDIGIHEVMIAAEKAQIAVKYAVTMKNKMIEAYKELMNTQI
jgi:flagellar hook-basal body complex protein FliE